MTELTYETEIVEITDEAGNTTEQEVTVAKTRLTISKKQNSRRSSC